MSLLDDELKKAIQENRDGSPDVDIRKAVALVLKQLDAPLADTWGCTHPGHLVTMIERLGMVSTEVQNVSDAKRAELPGSERGYREDLAKQLAELGANVIVMLVGELQAIRKLG